MIATVLVLPTPPALLPPGSIVDPVAELREACLKAVAQLPPGQPLVVLATPVTAIDAARGVAEPLGHRVAAHLLGDVPFDAVTVSPGAVDLLRARAEPMTLVVMADGSASRGEKAPGHLHPEAVAFDEAVDAALRRGDAAALAALDPVLAEAVWCTGAAGLRLLGELTRGSGITPEVSHHAAPYGVAWWVARWEIHAPVSAVPGAGG